VPPRFDDRFGGAGEDARCLCDGALVDRLLPGIGLPARLDGNVDIQTCLTALKAFIAPERAGYRQLVLATVGGSSPRALRTVDTIRGEFGLHPTPD
jgi:hypothetical protein